MREKHEQLEWEARVGRLAGFAALLAAGLIVASIAYRIAGLPHSANDVKEFLPEVHAHKNAFLVSGILTGIGMLAFIPPLLYLYTVTRYRRPELPSFARVLIFLGPILFAICAVWFQFRQAHAADQFVAGTVKTKKHAEDLLRNSTTAVAGLSLGASIATGLATILVSMNAMRAGLLSRFMGILGVILGALFVLPLIASPIIQLFWLLALGAMFMNIWPGGRGPAWETGEAVPWPTAQDRLTPPEVDEPDEPEPESESENDAEARQPNPRTSRKRKKKKARR
jgi:MFS family permease